MEKLYFNYYSVSSLIAFSMGLVLSTLFFIIRDKSSATLHLTLALAGVPMANIAYTFAYSYYDPGAAFHRWLTVSASLAIGVHGALLFVHFPRLNTPRIALAILIGAYVSGILATLNFFYGSLSAPRIYHFDGHYWDFDLPGPTRIVAIILLFSPILMLLAGITKAIIHEGRERLAVTGLLLTLFSTALIQGVTNVMSREGIIDRAFSQTAYSFSMVIGFFLVVVIYINNTRDRTSFMTKLVGISLVTLLLVMQALSFFSIREREQAYDQLRRYELGLALARDFRPANLAYIKQHALNSAITNFTYQSPDARKPSAPRGMPAVEIANALMRARLGALKADNFSSALPKILNASHGRFAGYREWIRGLPANESDAPDKLLQRLDRLQDMLRVRRNRIRRIKDKNFRAELTRVLVTPKSDFSHFAAAISKHMRQSRSEGSKLKQEVLEYLAPMEPPGRRRFVAEGEPAGTRNFVVFLQVNAREGIVYEGGFVYRSYRSYIHEGARTLVYLVLGVTLLIVVGFRFFFRGALVTPLNNLLEGVGKVNAGDFQVVVPVRVEDEFGYLSRSFNGMVASIREARARLKEHADNLEEKVKERTTELSNTLDQVQLLKTQQDGDYFLTSLLIRPLGANRAKSERVSVDFLVKQKKQFQFRKWSEEIGGDICMSDNVNLRGKNYTIFLNADAMGKSMQGAGGALVLGAVFDAIIKRTKLTSESQRQFPERWLKYAFLELHKVFISFDGTMLISLVIGLVEEDTGMLYYINAEHPWSVLYRKGKASFIEDTLTFRKLGTPGLDGQIFIKTMQMEPGDVVISGSDGRDDLKYVDEHGQERFADDEQEFLKRVEECDGVLERVLPALAKHGDLTDDLSLVRISYLEDHAPAETDTPEKANELLASAREHLSRADYQAAADILTEARSLDDLNRRAIKLLARAYIKMGRFDLALAQAEDYAYIAPGDTDMIFLASYCNRKLKNYSHAADYGERVRLRNPGDTRNLAHLAEVYIRMGNRERARELIEQALNLEPDHERSQKLREKLNASSAKSE